MNPRYRTGLHLAVVATLLAGGSAFAGALDPTDLAGNWSGGWMNTTFGSSGDASMVITIDSPTQMTMTIDLDGGVFGGPDPAAEDWIGAIGPGGVTVNQTSPLFGPLTLAIDTMGNLAGLGMPPNAGFLNVVFTGTVTESMVDINYVVNFTVGPPAVGTLTLTHDFTPVEASGWSAIKKLYR